MSQILILTENTMAPQIKSRSFLSHLRQTTRHNLHTLRTQPLAELSGSLGDLGTLLPLMTALTIKNSISLPSTLLFTGAANILTGIGFGIPLPVQPMKAIAAVAIARSFSLNTTAAAGIVVAALVGIMSITGMISWASKVTPVPVVKGIQMGAGLSLCLSASSSLLTPLSWTGEWWGDNLLWALGAAALLLSTLPFPRLPYALLVFALGVILSPFSPYRTPPVPIGPTIPILLPPASTFWDAATTASLGQLPLTLLNSVIAAAALASDLFPSPPHPAAPTVTSLGLSVAGINLLGCWFGAMPACHGSGGLAAQYRFGARSGSSIIILGVAKAGLGIAALFGPGRVVRVLAGFPRGLLGVLVLAAGVELARVGESVNTDARDLREGEDEGFDGYKLRVLDERERKERWMVMLVTVAALLAFRNDAVGFAAGLVWHWGFKATRRMEARSSGGWSWRRGIRTERGSVDEEGAGLLGRTSDESMT